MSIFDNVYSHLLISSLAFCNSRDNLLLQSSAVSFCKLEEEKKTQEHIFDIVKGNPAKNH